MKVGKLTSAQLENIIFKSLKKRRKEVLVRPSVGEDCAVVDMGEKLCVMSTDPITGTSEEIGKLAVHITCNDIASNGVEPVGIMLTILCPVGTLESELKKIMDDASKEAEKLNIEIIGGHTEITKAVNQIVISATGIGIDDKSRFEICSEVAVGDFLVLTKGAGIEGTGIIAYEKQEELVDILGEDLLQEAKEMLEMISVVKEGVIGGRLNIGSMHDVTEGGVLGALWEMSSLYDMGVEIHEDKIEISESTSKICRYYNIDPLKLISSGSMLMAVQKDKIDSLENEFLKNEIKYSIIGRFTEGKEKTLIGKRGQKYEIESPLSDELYSVI